MKTLCFKSTLLLSLLLAASIEMNAQTLNKDFHKEVNTSGSSELYIENQFGNITITDWDQNKVVIDVNVEVKASDESKARKLLDKITVEFKEDGNKIHAITKIGEDGKLNIKTNKGENQSFKINYTVKCPKNLNINLENQFGDIIVASLTGPLAVDLQFGSFNAVNLSGPEASFDVQFGKVTIGTVKNAKFDIQHCDLVKIDQCDNLTIDGQFATMNISKVKSAKADLNNCNVTLDELSGNLKLEINMGDFSIGNVTAGFDNIYVEQNMGDLNIGMDPKAGYRLKATVSMGSIKVPQEFKTSQEKESHTSGLSAEKVSGTVGDGSSSITIESNMGRVKIR